MNLQNQHSLDSQTQEIPEINDIETQNLDHERIDPSENQLLRPKEQTLMIDT